MGEGLSTWGGVHVVDAHAPVSVWDGIPFVDAHGPGGLELANHCRQSKTFKLWEKTHQCCMAGDGVRMGPLHHHVAIDPVQRRWRCLPVGVTWGPPHLPFVLLIHQYKYNLYGEGETQRLPARD